MARPSGVVERARVAVVGGGVAGCAAAIALSRVGIPDVVLLEASETDRIRVGETIPPDARRLLGLLGLGAAFDGEGHAPCHGSASSWGADELGYNDHFVHPLAHGWHLDRRRFDAWMGEQAERAGATRLLGARVAGVRRDGEEWRLSITREDEGSRQARSSASGELSASVVVDATGLAASIGRRLGARRLDHDRLTYLACALAFDPSAPRSGQTWLEATEHGWWYASQLPDGTWTVAVATDPEIVRDQELSTREGWQRAFAATRHLHPRLGRLCSLDERPAAWVASSSLLGPPAGAGWLAVGDAAAAYDPICARGIHKALEDGLGAAAAVQGALAGDGTAIGAFARRHILAFRAYLEQRAFLYAQETRWPEARFWQTRRARRNLVPSGAAARPDRIHSDNAGTIP